MANPGCTGSKGDAMPTQKHVKRNPVPLVIIGVIVLAAAAYGVITLTGNRSSVSLPGIGTGNPLAGMVNPDMVEGISDPLIRKHLLAQYNQPRFRITTVSSGLGAGESTAIMVDVRSETDFRFRMTQTDGNRTVQDMVTIGDDIYALDTSDSTWWHSVSGSENAEENYTLAPEDFSPERMASELSEKTTYTYENQGTEPCGVYLCHKYTETDGTEDSSVRTFWFDTKEFLLRREMNSYGEFTSESEYSYDGVAVETPSPVKDVPAGSSVYEMMGRSMVPDMMEIPDTTEGTMPSKEEMDAMMGELEKYKEFMPE